MNIECRFKWLPVPGSNFKKVFIVFPMIPLNVGPFDNPQEAIQYLVDRLEQH